LNRGEARVLFHGTQGACHVGDPNHPLRVCNNTECRLCGILRDGFKIDRASKYTTAQGISIEVLTRSRINLHVWTRNIYNRCVFQG
jgi:hypothetical protein